MLIKIKSNALGGYGLILRPRRLGIPHIAIAWYKVDQNAERGSSSNS